MKSLKFLISSLKLYATISAQSTSFLSENLPYPVVFKDIKVQNLDNSRQTKVEKFTFNKNNDPINKHDEFAGIMVWDVGTLSKNKKMDDHARYFLGDNSTGPLEEAEITPGHIYIRQSNLRCTFFDNTCVGRGMVHGGMVHFLFEAANSRNEFRTMQNSENVLLAGFSITGGRLRTSSAYLNLKSRRFSVHSSKCGDGSRSKMMTNCENYMLYSALEKFLKDGQTRHEYDADEFTWEYGTKSNDNGNFGYSVKLPYIENRPANKKDPVTYNVIRAYSDEWYPVERPMTCDANGNPLPKYQNQCGRSYSYYG